MVRPFLQQSMQLIQNNLMCTINDQNLSVEKLCLSRYEQHTLILDLHHSCNTFNTLETNHFLALQACEKNRKT